MTLALTFNGVTLSPISHQNQTWLTTKELSNALGYARPDSINKIFERNKDEFSDGMVAMLPARQNDVIGESSSLQPMQRLFSLRGCHLIAMFAKTVIAKEFRRWVLDILDKEINQKPYGLKEVEQPKYQPYTCPAYERITYIQREALTKIVHKIQNCCHFQNQANNAMYKQIRDQYKLDTIENLPAMHFDDVYAGLQNVLLLAEKHFENMVANDRRFIDCVIKKRQLPSAMQYSLLMA